MADGLMAAMNLDTQRSPSGYVYGLPLLFHANEPTHILHCCCYFSASPFQKLWAHRLAGREGIQNFILFETLHRVEGDQVFWERIMRLLAAVNCDIQVIRFVNTKPWVR
jgi:hypothetical protein